MRYECTRCGILIDEKYLSAHEALELLQWLDAQQERLLFISQQEPPVPQELPVSTEQLRLGEWSAEDERELWSESERIVNH